MLIESDSYLKGVWVSCEGNADGSLGHHSLIANCDEPQECQSL